MEKKNQGGNRLTQVHLEKWSLKRAVCYLLTTAMDYCGGKLYRMHKKVAVLCTLSLYITHQQLKLLL